MDASLRVCVCVYFTVGQHFNLHQRDQNPGSEAQIFSHGWKPRQRPLHVSRLLSHPNFKEVHFNDTHPEGSSDL